MQECVVAAKEGILTEAPSSPLRRKKTRFPDKKKSNEEQVQQYHEQLLVYIDSIEQKVRAVLQNNHSQFMSAYKGHVKKVREEMEEIRRKSASQQSSQQVLVRKISLLEKELAVFRQEALRLFSKLVEKDKLISQTSLKLKEITFENKCLEAKLFSFARRNKDLECRLNRVKIVTEEGPRTTTEEEKTHTRVQNMSQNNKYAQSQRVPWELPISPSKQQRSLPLRHSRPTFQNVSLVLDPAWLQSIFSGQSGDGKFTLQQIQAALQPNLRKLVINTRGNILTGQRVHWRSRMKKGDSNQDSNQERRRSMSYQIQQREMQGFFRQCINTVRKQIIKRNNIPCLNFYGSNGPISFHEFKTIDCLTLLKLVLSNEVVTRAIYAVLFGFKDGGL